MESNGKAPLNGGLPTEKTFRFKWEKGLLYAFDIQHIVDMNLQGRLYYLNTSNVMVHLEPFFPKGAKVYDK